VVPDADIPSPGALRALAGKYQRLSAWRGRRDGDGLAATRDELRALAGEFPGCLRELDTLGAPELARRAAACAAAAADPAAVEAWMAWIDGYHALVRRALAAREARGRGEPPAEDPFERAVLAPPGGRMGVVVMRALAARFGAPASVIAAALFPVRRASPYAL
jgi:hypothetical protein